MDFKIGRCIHTVHANKSPLKILDKRERVRRAYPGTAQNVAVVYVSFTHETHRKSKLCAPLRVVAVVLFYLRSAICTRVSGSGLYTRGVPAVMCRPSVFFNIGDTDNTGSCDTSILSLIFTH